MDPGGVGALIGIGTMAFIALSFYLKDRCEKKHPEHHALLTTQPQGATAPALPPPLLQRQKSSMRDFFEKNTKSSALKVIRIS